MVPSTIQCFLIISQALPVDRDSLGVDQDNWAELLTQTGVIGVMMFFLFRQLLSRADKFDESAGARETRMANRVTELETTIHSELMQVIKGNSETQAQTIQLLEETRRRLEETTERSQTFSLVAKKVLKKLEDVDRKKKHDAKAPQD